MRWLVRSVLAFVVLVVLAAGAVFSIPSEKIAGAAVAQFKTLTGRDLTISGSVRPSFWPQLGVKTGPVTVSNAAWSKEGPMLQAQGLSLAIDMPALIAGEVKITAISAIEPQIILERAADGQENWVFGGGGADGEVTQETPGVGAPFTIAQGLVENGALVFVDHAAGTRIALSSINAEVAIPQYRGPAQVNMQATLNAQAFAAAVSVEVFQDFLDGKLGPMDLTLQAGDADVAFKGRAGLQPLVVEGDLVASLGNLAAISALAGVASPVLPEGLGARSVTVRGAVTLTEAVSLHLRGGQITLDDNALSVDADLQTAGAVPNLVAKINAGSLNLASLPGGSEGAQDQGSAQAGAGWPQETLDASGLRAMDASVSVQAEGVDLGLVTLGASQLVATIENGRAVFDIRKVEAYGGTIVGNFVVNARKSLSVGGDLAFGNMDLQALLADFAGIKRLVGSGDLAVQFLGSGASVDAIMKSLKGSGQLALGKGALLGLDIGGMITSLDGGYVGEGQKTVFDSLAATFAVVDGVLSNNDLVLTSPFLTAEGAGEVGLGARDITYRIAAKAGTLADGSGGFTAPVLIRGPWADPQITLDLESLAQQRLDEEAAKLQALAKEKEAELRAQAEAKLEALKQDAKAKLEAELGGALQAGESVEDGVKRLGQDVIQDEAAKALEKLLGGGN